MRRFLVFLFTLLLATGVAAQQRCNFCGSQASVKMVKVGTETMPLCQECRTKPEFCSFCQKESATELLRDGRWVGRNCKSSRVFTQAQLDKAYADAMKFLKADATGIWVANAPPAQIADKDEIQTKFTESGLSISVSGFYQPYNPEAIYILSGQTPDKCAATIVHEYTHSWQSRNCPSQDRALKEGFASWMEYRYLMARGRTSQANALTRKSNPDYGASLQQLLKMEKKVGVEGILKFVQTERELP